MPPHTKTTAGTATIQQTRAVFINLLAMRDDLSQDPDAEPVNVIEIKVHED